uniref:WD repeat domain, phosphoinositide interacting 1 n=1 Tax=Sinocyclocheilus anshuiensis TaxID=1608454 RepID=A0A671Q0I2_9TELE
LWAFHSRCGASSLCCPGEKLLPAAPQSAHSSLPARCRRSRRRQLLPSVCVCVRLVESPDVYIVERLFSSSLMVVVSRLTPFRRNIYYFKKGTEICNYSYSDNILAVKLNRQMLVVCLAEALYIHNIKDIKLLKSLLNTPPNPKGLCALSVNRSSSYLAHPGSFTTGEITLEAYCNFNHVAAIAFNASGTNLASASEKGSVMRVFSTPDGVNSWTGYVTRRVFVQLQALLLYIPMDVGVKRGELIPEHEFADGPICLDDEQEFPPVSFQNR